MKKPKKTSPATKFNIFLNRLRQNLLPIFLSLLLALLTAITYKSVMDDKFYPLTFVGDTNISFLTEGQAIKKLQSGFEQRLQYQLEFSSSAGEFTIDLATSSASLDYSALSENFKKTHSSVFTFFSNSEISPKISLNIKKQLDIISSSVEVKPQNAKLSFDETPQSESTASSRIQVSEGLDGVALDREALTEQVQNFLLWGEYYSELPLKPLSPKITAGYLSKAKAALEALEKEPVELVFDSQSWTVDQKQLLTLLDLESGQDSLLSKDKTDIFFQKIAAETDQEVVEGLFEFNPSSKRVTAFKPSQEGRKLDQEKTFELLTETLGSSQKTITLPVEVVSPKIQTADVNNLGIKELLGRGISNFAGSIENRIYNINLTAAKINGVLVGPGETFSFNQTVGDITAATGFKQAYVIKEGRTVLDDGGGVCQVSTTLFRAVLNAGLPVVKRTAHAYRVGYYEQGFPPGLDATVFYPSVDFQFKNDTNAHILIQAYTVGVTLYVDLYGTPDGRQVTLTKPIITNQTPPPPELRQDDPTLPKGTVKQVDWAAWGANVSFKRTVVRAGQTLIDETWRSNYKPWQAVYLVGTKD